MVAGPWLGSASHKFSHLVCQNLAGNPGTIYRPSQTNTLQSQRNDPRLDHGSCSGLSCVRERFQLAREQNWLQIQQPGEKFSLFNCTNLADRFYGEKAPWGFQAEVHSGLMKLKFGITLGKKNKVEALGATHNNNLAHNPTKTVARVQAQPYSQTQPHDWVSK